MNKKDLINCDSEKKNIWKHCREEDYNLNQDQQEVVDSESISIPKK